MGTSISFTLDWKRNWRCSTIRRFDFFHFSSMHVRVCMCHAFNFMNRIIKVVQCLFNAFYTFNIAIFTNCAIVDTRWEYINMLWKTATLTNHQQQRQQQQKQKHLKRQCHFFAHHTQPHMHSKSTTSKSTLHH